MLNLNGGSSVALGVCRKGLVCCCLLDGSSDATGQRRLNFHVETETVSAADPPHVFSGFFSFILRALQVY